MSSTISTIIIILILAVILFFAIKNSIPHFRGEGACCGGGGKEKAVRPRKLESVVATKIIQVKGMRCDNCRVRVQNRLNKIDGVSAKVNLEKGLATVQLGKYIDDDVLVDAINSLGYEAEINK